MKNLFLIFLLISSISSAQHVLPDISASQTKSAKDDCMISGPATITSGSNYNYSINANLGQCTNCYDWDISGSSTPGGGDHAVPVGSDMSNSFTLKGEVPGTFLLVVTYFDENGCHSCQKHITVVPDCSGIEDDVEGDVTCFFTNTGNIQVDNLIDVSNVNQIEWVFEQSLNSSYYTGFKFNDSNDFQVTSTDPSNHFLEGFTFTGPCQGGSYEEIFLRRVVKITGCPAQYDTVRLYSENNTPIIKVSPNPATEKANVYLAELKSKAVTLSLYTMQGELISSQNTIVGNNDFAQQVELPNLSDRMFLLKVFENGKIIDTIKILRE